MRHLKYFENEDNEILLKTLSDIGHLDNSLAKQNQKYINEYLEKIKSAKIFINDHKDLVNYKGLFNIRPLQITIEQLKNVELTKALIEAGADVNLAINNDGDTPLDRAVCTDNIELVKLIIDAGADVNIGNIKKDDPPLIIAFRRYCAYWRDIQIVYLLIESGADWNLKDSTNADRNHDDFINYTDFYKMTNHFINKYPEKYKEYLLKKQCDIYNI